MSGRPFFILYAIADIVRTLLSRSAAASSKCSRSCSRWFVTI